MAKWLASEPKLAAVNGKSSSDVVSGAGFTVMVTVTGSEFKVPSLTIRVKGYCIVVFTDGATNVGVSVLSPVSGTTAGAIQV